MQLTGVEKTLNSFKKSIEFRKWNKSFGATLKETLSKLIPRDMRQRLAKIERQLAAVTNERWR